MGTKQQDIPVSHRPASSSLRAVRELALDLRKAGAEVLDRREEGENGKFGYVLDPEGNLLELWEQSDDDPSVPKKQPARKITWIQRAGS